MNTHIREPSATGTHVRLLSTILLKKESESKARGKTERSKKPVGIGKKELIKPTVHGNSTQRTNQKPQIG